MKRGAAFGFQPNVRRGIDQQRQLHSQSHLTESIKKYRSRSFLAWLRRHHRQCLALCLVLCNLWGTYLMLDVAARYFRRPKYRSFSERNYRPFRFPSVDERVRLYMGHWYLPPCNEDDKVSYRRQLPTTMQPEVTESSSWWRRTRPVPQYEYVVTELNDSHRTLVAGTVRIPSAIEPKRLFFITSPELSYCYQQPEWSIRFYCLDSQKSIISAALPDLGWTEDDFPVICQFSDQTDSFAYDQSGNLLLVNPRIPHLKKIRFSMNETIIDHFTRGVDTCRSGPLPEDPQPILWFLNKKRHFKFSEDIRRYDIPWNKKRNKAVFRGFYTGLDYDPKDSDLSNCKRSRRCRLVLEHSSSTLVDAKFTSLEERLSSGMLQGVNLTAPHLKKEELLEYKGQIMLEGNDVSSGLKWAMVSRSVVLMPPPRITSWLMEERLEPWIHYIPLSPDLSDVESKVQWMVDHSAEAQRISYRARLWVLDLYFHPQVEADDRKINKEILRRYRMHYK